MRTTIIILIAALFFASCTKSADEENSPQNSKDHIAIVGSTVITAGDVEKRLRALPDYAAAMYEGEEGIKAMIDELIRTELLYLQAKKDGLDSDPAYLENVEDYKKFALVTLMFERALSSKTEVSEKEAREFFQENSEVFMQPSQVRASHILVKTRKEAEEILKTINAGSSFESMAQSRSIDTNSAEQGGDLGFFSKGEMVPEFESVAFSLKVGELSKPVKSQFGYHIIKVTDRKAGETVAFSSVKDVIIEKLGQKKQQEAFEQYIETLQESYPVTRNNEKIKELAKTHKPTGETPER